jgi:hypothetical protein
MKRLLAAALVMGVALSGSVLAQETGLDNLHTQARVGNKVCMTEHEHYGEGTMASKQGATQAAIRSWADFTAFEYGPPWGSYALAAAKKMECSQTGSQWLCKTSARPCKRGR